MNSDAFCNWLAGFLDGNSPDLDREQIKTIREKLDSVKLNLPFYPPPVPREPWPNFEQDKYRITCGYMSPPSGNSGIIIDKDGLLTPYGQWIQTISNSGFSHLNYT